MAESTARTLQDMRLGSAHPDAAPDSETYLRDGLRGCEIRQSEFEGRGMGVYATQDILPGTIVLSEKPLLASIETGTRAGTFISSCLTSQLITS